MARKTTKQPGKNTRSARNLIPRNAHEESARFRALAAIRFMREDRLPLRKAAEKAFTDPATVVRYAGSALTQRTKGGPHHVRPYDRLERRMAFLSPSGMDTVVTVRDSRTATKVGLYMNAVQQFLNGDESALVPLRGQSFRAGGVRHEFVTDVATLTRLGEANVLAIEGLYRAIHGGAV